MQEGFKGSPGGMTDPLHFIEDLISQKPFRSPTLNHTYSLFLVLYDKTHPVTPTGVPRGMPHPFKFI